MDLVDVLRPYLSWSHLVRRVVLGVSFFAHGAQKVFGWFGGHGLRATGPGFRAMGIPPAAAVLAAFVECFGGLALVDEYNFALVGMALAILIGGAGALSIDRLLALAVR
jgi:putative oxidoreductase